MAGQQQHYHHQAQASKLIDDGFSVSLHLHGHVASNVDPRGFSDPKMPSLYSLRSWVLPRWTPSTSGTSGFASAKLKREQGFPLSKKHPFHENTMLGI